MIRRGFLLVASFAALVSLNVRPALANCAAVAVDTESTVPLAALAINTPLFPFEGDGRLLRGNLVTGACTQISNHRFDYLPSVVPSPDGRWISISGVIAAQTKTQYLLFDKRTGSDRTYHEQAAWGGHIPEFSPDSQSIVLYANYDSRWPSPTGTGLYLVDANSLRTTSLGNPSVVSTPANHGYAHVKWSSDGAEILMMMRPLTPGVEPRREHFAYRIREKRFERIAGEYEQAGDKFFRNGARLETQKKFAIQSQYRYRSLDSTRGAWSAHIDKEDKLQVSKAGRPLVNVAVGAYDQCRGVTIGINGWLDARHRVYTIGNASFVFDVQTGRKAVLFSDQKMRAAYAW